MATDGTVEAVEATDHPFALGVHWHVEDRIFAAFAQAARTAATRPCHCP